MSRLRSEGGVAGCVEDTFRAMLLFRTISVPCIEDTGGVYAAAYREDTSGQDMSPCIEDTLTIPNCMEALTHWEGRVVRTQEIGPKVQRRVTGV